MIIEQTIEVSASRRIFLDLPHNLPLGRAKLKFSVTPEAEIEASADGKLRLTKEMIEEMAQNSPTLQKLTGILHTDMTRDEIRTARLKKTLLETLMILHPAPFPQ